MKNLKEEEVRDRILSTFLKLLQERSYKRVTFKDLASEAGMTRQNLYYYYNSKEMVLEALIEKFFEGVYSSLTKAGSRNSGAVAQGSLAKEAVSAISEGLKIHEDIAKCFFHPEVRDFFLDKQVAFLKRLLGRIIRDRNIKVNDPKYIHYLALQVSGASYMVFKEWILVDTDFPAERIVDLGEPVVIQVIQSLEKN